MQCRRPASRGGGTAVLAAPVSSSVFASDVTDLLAQCNDTHLCGAFNRLNMATVPLNDNCGKYFRKEEGTFSTPVGPDSRMIILTFVLAALAEAGRAEPPEILAPKLVARFVEKCHRGNAIDKMDKWHIGRWGHIYYTVAAAIMMKERVERYPWALPILDAVAIEYHHAEESLYWRALTAYKYWVLKPDRLNRIQMARLLFKPDRPPRNCLTEVASVVRIRHWMPDCRVDGGHLKFRRIARGENGERADGVGKESRDDSYGNDRLRLNGRQPPRRTGPAAGPNAFHRVCGH